MEDRIKELLSDELNSINIKIDEVKFAKENNNLFLRICLDSNDLLDLDKIVEATNIINPILDKEDIIDEKYVLEVYGKSKGSDIDEKN